MQVSWDSASVSATGDLELELQVALSEMPDDAWYGALRNAARERGQPPWYGPLAASNGSNLIRVKLLTPVEKGDIQEIRTELDLLVQRANELAATAREEAERLTAAFQEQLERDPRSGAKLAERQREQDALEDDDEP